MWLPFLLALLCFPRYVLGNTEIVNFQASEANAIDIPLAQDWPILNPNHNELEWDILPALLGTPINQVCWTRGPKDTGSEQYPCPNELWVVLDLVGKWKAYSKFTLRLSWPASFSAYFSLDVYDPETIAAHYSLEDLVVPTSSTSKTRQKYGRIRVTDTGVPTPISRSSHNAVHERVSPSPVPIILILEPLYFGVLPPTVIPVLWYIVLSIAISSLLVPSFNDCLVGFAIQSEMELSKNAKRE